MADEKKLVEKPEPGLWEGEYLDAYGHKAQLKLNLNFSDQTLKGNYEIKFKTEDKPSFYRGEIEGKHEAGKVDIHFLINQSKEKGNMPEKILYQAQLQYAGSYAKQAMFGIVQSAPKSNFGGGVWIAWRFNKPTNQ